MGDWVAAAQAQIEICKLPSIPYSVLSNIANSLNNQLHENYLVIDTEEKRILYAELANLMERRKREANADDLSRLSWLYLHLRDPDRAREIAQEGRRLDDENEHCNRLLRRLAR